MKRPQQKIREIDAKIIEIENRIRAYDAHHEVAVRFDFTTEQQDLALKKLELRSMREVYIEFRKYLSELDLDKYDEPKTREG